VSDPILLFLAMDAVALLMLGTFAAVLPPAACGFLATALSGLGALLCLPPMILRLQATAQELPAGPPGLSLHLALDPLATVFLIIVFLAGTAIAAFQATTAPAAKLSAIRVTAFCLAGTALSLIAADGVTLAIGVAITCATIWTDQRQAPALLIPLLLLAAVCLLTPSGFAPRFDTIRAAPIDSGHATAAAALTLMAIAGLAWPRAAERCWTRDALTAGIVLPAATYLLLRLVADLSGGAGQAWWGFILLLAGGLVMVLEGWRPAALADIDTAIAALIRRQAGLTLTGAGLALVARAADLSGAESFALEAVFLTTIGGSLAGTLASLAAHAIGSGAGTYRLSRLGGLVHLMPGTSAALAAGILAMSALPPGLGFASLWLLFQSILSAPRTGGLLAQLPLALIAAALALSAALSTAASVRLIGIALLGRPRSPRGSGAQERSSPPRTILLTLGAVSLLAGVLPGPVLRLLADPAIRALTGVPSDKLALLPASSASPGYLALPVLALVALAAGAVMLAFRRSRQMGKMGGVWADGMAPPVGLPFGEPAAQSAGAGFLPALPAIPLAIPLDIPLATILLVRLTHLLSRTVRSDARAAGSSRVGSSTAPARITTPRPPSAVAGVWLMLAGFGALLLVLAVAG
jgi:hydrogenase-4 component B